MTTLRNAIDALQRQGEQWHGAVPDNWLQGRTAYGGFSAALAVTAAQRDIAELPPLRSAQIAFVGPLAGAVTIRPTLLRRGRNAAFVQVDVAGAAGLGLRATFVFMREIASAHDVMTITTPDFPVPDAATQTYSGARSVAFAQNFELLDRREGTGPAEWLRWVRMTDREGLDPAAECLAIADCLPPAALKLIGAPVPLSTVTWQLNLLTPTPATRDGWWLLHADTGYLRGGSSSQPMAMWNADGMPVGQGTQSVALFG